MRLSFRFLSPDGDPSSNGAASGAPAAPAPAPAPAPAAPAEPQNIRSVLQSQRSQLTAAGQPRDEGGRFVSDRPGTAQDGETPVGDGTSFAPDDEDPAAATADPTTEPVAGEEGDLPTGDEPDEEPTGDEPAAPEVVAIPGRQPTDPDLEIEVSDPVVAERLRQLKNAAMHGAEYRAGKKELREAEGRLRQIQTEIRTDPVGFTSRHLTPELRREMALQLLADDDTWQAVQQEVFDLGDPDRRELVVAKLQARQYQLREQLRQDYEQDQRLQQQYNVVEQAVEAMIPDEWDEDRRELFKQDCFTDLGRWLRQVGASAVNAADIPAILAKRLRSAGLNLMQTTDRMFQRLEAASDQPRHGSGRHGKGGNATPAVTGQPAARATARPRDGASFVAARARRQQAAAAGPGSSPIAPAAGGRNGAGGKRIETVLQEMRQNIGG